MKRLSKNLERGQDLETTQQIIQTTLKLTTESFKRLMQIIGKSDLTPTQESALPEDEWEELFSILVQAQKVSLFQIWIEEELTLESTLPPEDELPTPTPVLFSPKYFWISLRPLLEGDWPPAPDCPTRLPLIDPELGTLETLGELPAPLTGKFAVILWERRQIRLEVIKAELIGVSEFENKVIHAVGSQDPNDSNPWPYPPRYNTLGDLKEALNTPATKAEAIAVIHQNLYLTVPGFKRLMGIKAIADDPNTEPTPDQWDEVHRLLTTAQKLKREYPTPGWSTEEDNVPILDPDLLKLTDLPEPTVGKLALTLWQTRRDQIDRTYESLQTTQETEGFEVMLVAALGPHQDSWSEFLNARKSDLDSGDDTRVREAREAIATILCMTVEDFNHLMEIKAKAEANNPQNQPTQPEWAEVYTILTQSHKFKQCYPRWLEEASLNYWQKLKAKLPRWRATPETRALWQRALRLRSQSAIIDSQSAIIDPDVIGDEDLKTLIEGDPAYDILRGRQQWSDDQTSNLKNIRDNNLYLRWESHGNKNSEFDHPWGVAVDEAGNVYVTDSENHRIQKFREGDGSYPNQWGSEGSAPGQFQHPRGIAVDAQGNIYVADQGNNRIQKFAPNGIEQRSNSEV
ncbi:hypothetical protein [Leptodesmis sp.]|uniref:hypothetical protein n=1 Tax=Leptodesmis sp. TaxID=3100501 RepID=UPI00405353FE